MEMYDFSTGNVNYRVPENQLKAMGTTTEALELITSVLRWNGADRPSASDTIGHT